MRYELADEGREKYFQYDEDTEVLIQLITKPQLREIAKQAAKKAKVSGQDQADIADKLLGRAAVKGWRKIGDPSHPGLIVGGQPLTFTPENIDLLMRRSLKFSRFVNEMCIDEDEFAGDGDLAETKNV